jgi:hypothetical protein
LNVQSKPISGCVDGNTNYSLHSVRESLSDQVFRSIIHISTVIVHTDQVFTDQNQLTRTQLADPVMYTTLHYTYSVRESLSDQVFRSIIHRSTVIVHTDRVFIDQNQLTRTRLGLGNMNTYIARGARFFRSPGTGIPLR